MNRQITRTVLVAATIVVFISLVAWVLTRPQILKLGTNVEAKPDFVFVSPNITENYAGVKQWQLQATKGEFYKDKQEAYIYDVSANSRSQDNTFLLSADKGMVDMLSNRVVLYDCSIRMVNSNFDLHVDELLWMYDKYLITGKGNVVLKQNNVVVNADLVEGSLKDDSFVFRSRPRVAIKLENIDTQ